MDISVDDLLEKFTIKPEEINIAEISLELDKSLTKIDELIEKINVLE